MIKHYDISDTSFKKLILDMWLSWDINEEDFNYFINSYNKEIYENNYSQYTNKLTTQIVNDIKNNIGLLGNI